jgi:hypothetical protein
MNRFKQPKIKTKSIKKIFDFEEKDFDFYYITCNIDDKILDEVRGKLVSVILNEDEDDVCDDFFDIIRYRRGLPAIKLEVWGGDLKSYITKKK